MTKIYPLIALGGTFDRLHIGHHHHLDTAASRAENLIIGLTDPAMTTNKTLSQLILPYAARERELLDYLRFKNYASRSRIIKLKNIYGTTITDPAIKALAVTPHTLTGADHINQERKNQKKSPLPVITTNLIHDQRGDYISSTKIRQGLINRQGQVYSQLFHQDTALTADQKTALSKPQGPVFSTVTQVQSKLSLNPPKVALIGDYITQWFDDHQLPFHYSVIDHMNQRQPYQLKLQHFQPDITLHAKNPPGHISSDTAKHILQLTSKPTGLLDVKGEEDLAALPMLLSLPLNSQIFYGQPNLGVVMIAATESTKQKYAQFINTTF